MVYSIDGYFVDDKTPFTNQLVTDGDNTPDGYSDDQIFFYGVNPEVGKRYGDFIVTNVSEV